MGRTALPLALLLGVLPAQEILWQRIGVDWQYQFRAVYNSIGDVDRDGYPELLALMGVIVSQTQAPVQELWVLSGRDGSTLRKLREPVGRIFEMTAATGDLDGDGIGDYALKVRDFGQPPSNYVEARSGIDDRLLWSVQGSLALAFGAAILGDLDLDGDGRPNVVITFPNGGPNNRALVFAYDHQGNLLYQVGDTGDDLFYGEDGRDSIGIVGDLDGDGAEDFVLGGGYVGSGGGGVVLSGRDGTVLQVGVSPVRSDSRTSRRRVRRHRR